MGSKSAVGRDPAGGIAVDPVASVRLCRVAGVAVSEQACGLWFGMEACPERCLPLQRHFVKTE